LSSSIRDTGRGKSPKPFRGVVTAGMHEGEGSAAKDQLDAKEPATTLAEVLTRHELGIGTPRRSVVVDWFDANEEKLRTDLRKISAAALKRGASVEQGLQRFGAMCVGQMQQRIKDGIEPELSDRRKVEKEKLTGSAKDTPLILTGQLRSSIRSMVEVAA
jgi:hypothetical protein